jgi:hypothetical protein
MLFLYITCVQYSIWNISVLLIFVIIIVGKVCSLLTGYYLCCVVSSLLQGSELYAVYVPALFSPFHFMSV